MKRTTKRPKPNKHLGQNFLINPSVITKILDSCALTEEDTVLAIGPGEGALTPGLSSQAQKVIAVEADKNLALKLKGTLDGGKAEVVHQDFMKFDLKKLNPICSTAML